MARKSRNHRLDLPTLELECMKALWARGQSTVHGIRADLLPARPLAYTTVMTVMGRLARKGVVGRERHGRAHVYRPLVSGAEVRDFTLDRLIEDFFRGSRDGLRRHLEGGGSEGNAIAEPAGESSAGSSDDAAAEVSAHIAAGTPPAAPPSRAPVTDRRYSTPLASREGIDPSLL